MIEKPGVSREARFLATPLDPVAAGFLCAGLIWCGWLLLVPALNGVADNGDFQRILGKVGMAATPNDVRDSFFFAHVRRLYPIKHLIRFSPVSTGVVFAETAKLARAVFDRTWFDIRCLGVAYAAALLAGYACALRYIARRAASLPFALLASAACFLLLLNPFFVALLNSFYEEAAFVALLPLLAFYPLARTAGPLTRREGAGLAVLILGVAATKAQNIMALLLLLPLWVAWGADRARTPVVLLAAAIGLVLLPLHIERTQGLPNAFNRLFLGVALVQPAAVADLGLGRFSAFIGAGFYQAPRGAMPAADRQDIRDKAAVGRVSVFLATHPAVALRLAGAAVRRMLGLPLAEVPYLAYSERGGIAGIPPAFRLLTVAVAWVATLAALAVAALRGTLGRREAAWLLVAAGLYGVSSAVVVLGEGFNEFGRHMICANFVLTCAAVVTITAAVARASRRRSFLKKRTKKLLPLSGSIRVAALNDSFAATCKSFLLLFFKKEESSFLQSNRS